MQETLSKLSDIEILCSFISLSSMRYALTSGVFFMVFYIVFKTQLTHLKIQSKYPLNKDLKREIKYSIFTLLVFSLSMLIPLNHYVRPFTFIYTYVSDFGIFYFLFSCLALVILHDAYFYFTHRLLHHKWFKRFHVIHHQSTNPTPLTALSFHPIEALIQVLFFIIIPFIMPVHIFAIGFLGLFLFIHNAYGHSGFEFSFLKNAKIYNNSINHNLHHKHYHGNYGLYFTFWDNLLKTRCN